jgi:hypothetical protein
MNHPIRSQIALAMSSTDEQQIKLPLNYFPFCVLQRVHRIAKSFMKEY